MADKPEDGINPAHHKLQGETQQDYFDRLDALRRMQSNGPPSNSQGDPSTGVARLFGVPEGESVPGGGIRVVGPFPLITASGDERNRKPSYPLGLPGDVREDVKQAVAETAAKGTQDSILMRRMRDAPTTVSLWGPNLHRLVEAVRESDRSAHQKSSLDIVYLGISAFMAVTMDFCVMRFIEEPPLWFVGSIMGISMLVIAIIGFRYKMGNRAFGILLGGTLLAWLCLVVAGAVVFPHQSKTNTPPDSVQFKKV